MTTQPDLVKDLYEGWSAAFEAEPDMPLEKWRAMVEEWPRVTPKGAAEDRVILAVHGGGFVVGSMYTHRKLFGHMAKQVGVRALARTTGGRPSIRTRRRWGRRRDI
jgi:acetyl esterase/lipase